MKRTIVSAVTLLFAILMLTLAAQAAYTFKTIDDPGTNENPSKGYTWCYGINNTGLITGYYLDTAGNYHSFVQSSSGSFTHFDDPLTSGLGFQRTYAQGINDAGQIVGYWDDTSASVSHGFLRSADGSLFTAIDDPDAVGTFLGGTFAQGINHSGQIVGYYTDAGGKLHGFLRSADGTQFTTIEDPDAVGETGFGTVAMGINDSGQVVGYYADAKKTYHGFVMSADGSKFTTIDNPSATTTSCYGINNTGQISGTYTDAKGTYGFVGSVDGSQFTTLNDPYWYSSYYGINDTVQITGIYDDTNGYSHGFVATPPPTYSISGTVKDGVGALLEGVTIALSGTSSAKTQTVSNGTYSFTGLHNGTYTVKPSESGYSFNLTEKTLTINKKNMTANFTGTPVTISGKVLPFKGKTITSVGQNGITIDLNGKAVESATTDSFGDFTFSTLVNGAYTVKPVPPVPTMPQGETHPTLSFSPAKVHLSISGGSAKPLSFKYKSSASCSKCH